MIRTGPHWLRHALFCALAMCVAAPLRAQLSTSSTIKFANTQPANPPSEPSQISPPAAFPDWPDQPSKNRPANFEAPSLATGAPSATGPSSPPSPMPMAMRTPEHSTYSVKQASAEMPAPMPTTSQAASAPATNDGLPPARDPRCLGAPKPSALTSDSGTDRVSSPHRFIPDFGVPADTMYTTGAALTLVVGLFLLCAWGLRRGARKSVQLLSSDVAQVLSRVPLAARQFAELVHVGNKLVLVSVTSAGAETLTEITDPLEVDRLLGICRQRDGRSSTTEFDEVFRQLTEEDAPAGFLGEETIRLDARSAAGAYAAQRGGARRA